MPLENASWSGVANNVRVWWYCRRARNNISAKKAACRVCTDNAPRTAASKRRRMVRVLFSVGTDTNMFCHAAMCANAPISQDVLEWKIPVNKHPDIGVSCAVSDNIGIGAYISIPALAIPKTATRKNAPSPIERRNVFIFNSPIYRSIPKPRKQKSPPPANLNILTFCRILECCFAWHLLLLITICEVPHEGFVLILSHFSAIDKYMSYMLYFWYKLDERL